MSPALKAYVSVNAIITGHSDHTKIVLVQLARPEDKKGTWALPGGKVDEGETLMDALRREVKEETGIDPSAYDARRLAILHDIPSSTCKHVFHLRLKQDVEFVTDPAEILSIAWTSTDDDTIKALPFRAPWVAPLIHDFLNGKLNAKLYSQEAES